MALIAIAPDLWHVRAPDMRLPGGVRMPVASTLVRVADGSLLLYSPVPLDDDDVRVIGELGEVRHLIAPSLWHHLHVAAARERFATAIVHAAPGLANKRPDLHIDHELADGAHPWGDAIDVCVIAGAPKLNEAVLFHRPSGTLVCADLVFNITHPENFMSRMLFSLTGVNGQLAQSRVWTAAVRDRAAARASIERLLAWPIERVAPCHGDVVAIDAAAFAPKLSRAYGGSVPVPA
jgi:hypothetical protein